MYDSACNIDSGEMTVKELKKNDMYLITMTVNKAFLEDKNTVYPVYVDPQIDVDNLSTTANIIDTTIYSGKPTLNTGTWALNHAGLYSDMVLAVFLLSFLGLQATLLIFRHPQKK